MMMKISNTGITLLKILEGCKLKAYKDSVGVLTVGFGHTGIGVKKDMVITQVEADKLLLIDLLHFEKELNKLVKVALTQNQVDSLVIFMYNIGYEAFEKSTLLSLLNKNDKIKASEQFIRWNKGNSGKEI